MTGWGVLGIGNQADKVMVPALNLAADSAVVAVCSRDADRATEFAGRHSVAHSYTTLDDLLADSDVDAIYVATPNALHADQVIAAAEAGKHVLCEKPLALTLEEGQRMVEACSSAGVQLGVNLQNRFHPAHVEMRQLIESGEAGELVLIEAEYSRNTTHLSREWKKDPGLSGGGAIMSLGTHVLDLVSYLAGTKATEVTARADATGWDLEVDDLMVAILVFEGRLRATGISGFYVPRSANDVVVYGSAARMRGEGTVGMPLKGRLIVDREGHEPEIREYKAEDPTTGSYVRLVNAFLDSVANGAPFAAGGEAGLELITLVNAVLESTSRRQSVTILRP